MLCPVGFAASLAISRRNGNKHPLTLQMLQVFAW